MIFVSIIGSFFDYQSRQSPTKRPVQQCPTPFKAWKALHSERQTGKTNDQTCFREKQRWWARSPLGKVKSWQRRTTRLHHKQTKQGGRVGVQNALESHESIFCTGTGVTKGGSACWWSRRRGNGRACSSPRSNCCRSREDRWPEKRTTIKIHLCENFSRHTSWGL